MTRPHCIAPHALVVRDGIFSELEVPYGAIAGARITRRPNFGRSGLKVDPASATAILAMDDANVELDLDPAAEIHRTDAASPLRPRALRITVDDRHVFVRELRARCMGSHHPLLER